MPTYVLAYSGGLDTSVMLSWLREKHGAKVVTVTADLGQLIDRNALAAKARSGGADQVFIDDLQEEFVAGYCWPALKAGALYQGVYPLATALGRPLIAKRLVEVARSVGADAIVHGCTGKGNDQVRIEVSVGAIDPSIPCLAPLRSWELTTREAEIAWAQEHGVPVSATLEAPYSIDDNLWGMAIECGALEDPALPPPDDSWQITADPMRSPDIPQEIAIGFESGVPMSLDGETLAGPTLVRQLNSLAAAHGVGRIDMIEDRLVGIKSRELYEAPGAVLLHTARQALEQLVLDRETRRLKDQLGHEFARLVYDGLWFTPLRTALSSFFDSASEPVTGSVRLKCCRGQVTVQSRESPNTLYRPKMATYGEGDSFDHGSAAGFIDLFGLSARITGQRGQTDTSTGISGPSSPPDHPAARALPLAGATSAGSRELCLVPGGADD